MQIRSKLVLLDCILLLRNFQTKYLCIILKCHNFNRQLQAFDVTKINFNIRPQLIVSIIIS